MLAAALLHDAAMLQDGDLVRHQLDDRQIVTDEQAREPKSLLEFGQQRQNRGLHGHVERGRGFVGDQEFGVQRERPCDADALSLPAGELVRESIDRSLRQILTLSSNMFTRSRISACDPNLLICIGAATESPIDSRGFSDEPGSWKTIE